MKKMISVILCSFLLLTVSTAALADTQLCSKEKAMGMAYGFIKAILADKQYSELRSNITDQRSDIVDGFYNFRFSFIADGDHRVASFDINEKTCEFNSHLAGTSVVDVSIDGKEK